MYVHAMRAHVQYTVQVHVHVHIHMYIISQPGQSTIFSFLTEMGVRYVTVKRMPGVGTNSLKV